MNIYWLTFRIAETSIGGLTRADRYDALVKVITDRYPYHWVQAGSRLAFGAPTNVENLAEQLERAIAPNEDWFLLKARGSKSAYMYGNNNDPEILTQTPRLKTI